MAGHRKKKWSSIFEVLRVQTSLFPIKTSDFVQFDSLRTKMYLYDIYIYRTVNTLCFGYKNQSVNVV